MITEDLLHAFHDELRKEAGFGSMVAKLAPQLRAAGSLGAVGGVAGGALGGIAGGVSTYRKAREAGYSRGQALAPAAMSGLGGAIGGAALGGLAGGAIGGISGRGAGLAGRTDFVGSVARQGQQEMHGLTGMLRPHELEAIGGGASNAVKHVDYLKAQGAGAGVIDRAQRAESMARDAQEQGLTSIPGYARAIQRNGLRDTLGTSFREQAATSPWWTYGGLALGSAGIAKAYEGPAQDQQGRGRFERIGDTIGTTVGGIAGGVVPVVGNAVMANGLGAAGKYTGRAVDRGIGAIRGRGRQLQPLEETNTMPVEHNMSSSVAGQTPEGWR